jgi:hypothetical protein
MEDFGKLVVYLINKDRLSDFKTTRSFSCTKEGVLAQISKLKLEGEVIQSAYYNNKKLKIS